MRSLVGLLVTAALGVSASACTDLSGPGQEARATTDPGPLAVVSTSPANNVVPTTLPTSISATFSAAVDPATVTTTSFVVRVAGTSLVSGTLGVSGATATFTPAASLEFNTTYSATLTTDIRDLSGSPLPAQFTWSFTTPVGP